MNSKSETNPFIAALGGTFIYSENASELAQWYYEMLGIEHEYSEEYKSYYTSFPYNDLSNPGLVRYTAWSIIQTKVPLQETIRNITINYRVHNIHELIDHLRSKEIEVTDVEYYPEGLFSWLQDPDGNEIELWEDSTVEE
ncbi:MAG: hypothetical protein JEZ03_03250 [Bacteroidales bacterium]|nr:hypothetical protein [Bacteroidales bacterium]